MLSDFDRLVQERNALEAWWKLGSKHVGYGSGLYELRVDTLPPPLVAYCGQETAGGRNYHDAPKFFIEVLRKEIAKHVKSICKDAYKNHLAQLNAEILKLKESVLSELEKCEEQ